jgi:hypothetical protein
MMRFIRSRSSGKFLDHPKGTEAGAEARETAEAKTGMMRAVTKSGQMLASNVTKVSRRARTRARIQGGLIDLGLLKIA